MRSGLAVPKAFLFGMILVASPFARAEAANGELRSRAQQLVKQGAALHDKGQDAAALAKFKEAYALYPSPKLQYNIGQLLADLGNAADAADALEDFVDQTTLDPSVAPAEYLERAKTRLASLRPLIGRIDLTVRPSGAQVQIDGLPRRLGSYYLSPGAHQVIVSLAGFQQQTQVVAVAASQQRILAITLVPETSSSPALSLVRAPDPAPASAPAGGLSTSTAEAPAGEDHTVPYLLLGTGAAALVASATLGALSIVSYRSAGQAARTGNPTQFSSDHSTSEVEAGIAWGTLAVGITCAIAGGYLEFRTPGTGGAP